MTLNEYQSLASRTALSRSGFTLSETEIMIVWNAAGLAGESGEVAEIALFSEYGIEPASREATKKRTR